MRPHAQLQSKLEQKIAKLETHLEHFPSDAVHLQVNHPAEQEVRARPAASV
jgi:t-SNARE complex subunit (syntaxin)